MGFYSSYSMGDEGLATFYAHEAPVILPTQADIDTFHADQKARIMAKVGPKVNEIDPKGCET